jgi:hypothetical protein
MPDISDVKKMEDADARCDVCGKDFDLCDCIPDDDEDTGLTFHGIHWIS